MKHYSSICLLVLPCMLTSCLQDGWDNSGTDSPSLQCPIDFVSQGSSTFSPSSADKSTRASQTSLSDIVTYGVTASHYANSESYSNAACGSYFYNVTINADDGISGYYWPGMDYRLSFYAYTPCDNPLFTLSSDAEHIGMPVYQYTVPESVNEQLDILTCNVLDHVGLSRDPVPLTFNHKCSDVRFSAFNQSPETLRLKSIAIVGMKYQATLQNDNWVLMGDFNTLDDNAFVLNSTIEIEPDENVDVTSSDDHFILIPQTVRSGTDFIIVTTVELGEEHVYCYTLPQDFTFNPGFSYNFKLTLGYGSLLVNDVVISPWSVTLETDGDMEIVEPGD